MEAGKARTTARRPSCGGRPPDTSAMTSDAQKDVRFLQENVQPGRDL